jgi:hypothetical protein
MSSQDLVAEGFKARKLEGLGDVFVCRICDTIFVSANDALRHLQLYHKILSAVRLRQVLEERLRLRAPQEERNRATKSSCLKGYKQLSLCIEPL